MVNNYLGKVLAYRDVVFFQVFDVVIEPWYVHVSVVPDLYLIRIREANVYAVTDKELLCGVSY